jgi:hypothetical protein
MSMIYIIPTIDTIVLNPEQKFRPVPLGGEWAVYSEYWARRARAGEITIHQSPPVQRTNAPKTKAKKTVSTSIFEEFDQ